MGQKAIGRNARNVAWLKEYLTKRGIPVPDQGKRKAELVEQAKRAFLMKLLKMHEEDKDLPKRQKLSNKRKPAN